MKNISLTTGVELEASKKSLLWDKNVIFWKNKRKILLVTPDQTKFRFLLVLKI
jgi:hypothetical protein